MAAQTQTRIIKVSVDTRNSEGLRQIAQSMGLLNDRAKQTAGNMNFLTNAFRGWLGYLGVRELAQMSDNIQTLRSRLKVVTGSAEEGARVFDLLAQKARESNSTLGNMAVTFTRLGRSTLALGLNTRQVADLAEIMANSFKLSGATMEEAQGATIQLGQAFSRGTLRGQELNSVMSQNEVLAGLLKKAYGQDLYKKAEQGAITVSAVLKILFENQKAINEQAKDMKRTFGETIAIAMDRVSIKVQKLAEKLGATSAFATAMDFVVDRIEVIAIAITVTLIPALLAVAYVAFPALIQAILKFRVASQLLQVALGPVGWLTLALGALGAALIIFNPTWDEFIDAVVGGARKFTGALSSMADSVEPFLFMLPSLQLAMKGISAIAGGLNTKLEEVERSRSFDKIAAASKEMINVIGEGAGAGLPSESGAKESDKDKLKSMLKSLNAAFMENKITVEEYQKSLSNFNLRKVSQEFREGAADIFAYNEAKRQIKIEDLNLALNKGSIAIADYNDNISSIKVDELNEKLQSGKINLIEYNKQLVDISTKLQVGGALQVGTQAYLDSIGSTSSQLAKTIQGTFSSLEDTFFEFTKTGQLNFEKMTQAILDDLAKIAIRAAIIRPIANGILGSFGGGSGVAVAGGAGGGGIGSNSQLAKGGSFENGVRKFASGGIVDSPTMFRYGGNKTGLMGEAGTEAIVPLKRGSNGDLGVQASTSPVIINIVNNSGSEITQRETTGPSGEKVIELLVQSKVKEGLQSGAFDKQFQSSFGLRRKGV
jgi:lambda family phage tail tape measure protein